MTAASFAAAVVPAAPSWPARWWRAFVRLLPLAAVYMLFVSLKDLPHHLAFTATAWQVFVQSWVGELIVAVILVGFVAAVDLMPIGGRARIAADAVAILFTEFVGGIVNIWILDALGALVYGRFTTLQLVWANAGGSAVEAAFALLLYRLWQRQRRRSAALRDMQRAHVELLRRTAQADLVAMQARIDPTFLFDTLDDVEKTYDVDAARGRRLVDALIAYLRAVLPGVDSEASTLGKECDIARSYVELACARGMFDGEVAIDVPASLRGAAFPPMVIAPLVEDAVRGMRGTSARIRLEAHGATALAVVLDADRPHEPSAAVVEQVRQRLSELTTGGTVTLTLEARKTRILLEIPHATNPGPDR